jgi:16S rRNA (cytidine1402-2'-O)-methyltransferase
MPLNQDNKKTLFIFGTPLKESLSLPKESLDTLKSADIIIAESRKNFFQIFPKSKIELDEKKLYFLDPSRKETYELLFEALDKPTVTACLLSDSGMPILFDPGEEVLEFCKKNNFKIRTLPTATSWGTACSVSGFEPPFYILGFLPQKEEEWNSVLKKHQGKGHLVLLETPYRFEKFLKNLISAFGKAQEAFLAYEIAGPQEDYIWGTLDNILRETQKRGLVKGEFVVIVKSG